MYLSRILLSKLASFKYIRAQLSSTSLFSYSSQGYTQSVGAVIGYYKSRFISKIVDIRWFKMSFFTLPGESNGSMVSVSAPISTSLPSRKPWSGSATHSFFPSPSIIYRSNFFFLLLPSRCRRRFYI